MSCRSCLGIAKLFCVDFLIFSPETLLFSFFWSVSLFLLMQCNSFRLLSFPFLVEKRGLWSLFFPSQLAFLSIIFVVCVVSGLFFYSFSHFIPVLFNFVVSFFIGYTLHDIARNLFYFYYCAVRFQSSFGSSLFSLLESTFKWACIFYPEIAEIVL